MGIEFQRVSWVKFRPVAVATKPILGIACETLNRGLVGTGRQILNDINRAVNPQIYQAMSSLRTEHTLSLIALSNQAAQLNIFGRNTNMFQKLIELKGRLLDAVSEENLRSKGLDEIENQMLTIARDCMVDAFGLSSIGWYWYDIDTHTLSNPLREGLEHEGRYSKRPEIPQQDEKERALRELLGAKLDPNEAVLIERAGLKILCIKDRSNYNSYYPDTQKESSPFKECDEAALKQNMYILLDTKNPIEIGGRLVVPLLMCNKWKDNAQIFPGGNLPFEIINNIGSFLQRFILALRIGTEYNRTNAHIEQLGETQRRQLPPEIPVNVGSFEYLKKIYDPEIVSRVEIALEWQPQKGAISGDFICASKGRNHTTFTLGDVIGKGLSAAPYALGASTFMSFLPRFTGDPARIISLLNDHIGLPAGYFTVLNSFSISKDLTINWVHAGAEPPILYRKSLGECVHLTKSSNMPLGVGSNLTFEGARITLEPGDIFILLSDGITEARNPRGELFGVERLFEVIRDNGNLSAQDLKTKILEAVEKFRDGMYISDDTSILILKIRETPLILPTESAPSESS